MHIFFGKTLKNVCFLRASCVVANHIRNQGVCIWNFCTDEGGGGVKSARLGVFSRTKREGFSGTTTYLIWILCLIFEFSAIFWRFVSGYLNKLILKVGLTKSSVCTLYQDCALTSVRSQNDWKVPRKLIHVTNISIDDVPVHTSFFKTSWVWPARHMVFPKIWFQPVELQFVSKFGFSRLNWHFFF